MQQLLLRIQQEDDQQAFRELYRLLFFRLYQFAFSYLKEKQQAEEVVNDVFLELWNKRRNLSEIRNINVYLYVSIKNSSLNRLRRLRKPAPMALEDLELKHICLSINPEAGLVTKELQYKVQAAIEALPPRCKLIFKLVKEDGLSYKEAADILDVSVKTVDAQLYIALKKLSVSLLPVWTEYGILTKKFIFSKNFKEFLKQKCPSYKVGQVK